VERLTDEIATIVMMPRREVDECWVRCGVFG
jgi:hypothetical protein